MIPANQMTIAETAYSLAIECAERHAKRFHRLSFWVPIWGREFQIKAKMWDYTVQRLKKHAQFLGPKKIPLMKMKYVLSLPEGPILPPGYHILPGTNCLEPKDICIPPRPEDLFSVGE